MINKELYRKYQQAWELYRNQRLSVSVISKQTKISKYKVAIISKCQNIEEIWQRFILKKQRKFKRFHKRTREEAQSFVQNARSFVQAVDVQRHLMRYTSQKISLTSIRDFLKQELCLTYKRVKPIMNNHNSPINKACRQIAAGEFIRLLHSGKRIINIDESPIKLTDSRQRGWSKYGQVNQITCSQRLLQVNIIAAIGSTGDIFYTINNGYTNTKTFILFMQKLILQLDKRDTNWRDNTVILLDNAPYHRSQELLQFFKDYYIPIMFLGPYQYKLAPIELFFSFIKNRDLNPLNMRAYSNHCRGYISLYIKELCLQINRLEFKCAEKCFAHVLTAALEFLSFQDL